MFFKARHTIVGTTDIRLGMAFHIVLNSIKKAWQDFNGSHVIFCLDGKSWRKSVYPVYKLTRPTPQTPKEVEEDAVFWEAFGELKEFLSTSTNCTILSHPELEADDLIAGVIQHHPYDNHVIVSSDSDFLQLVAPNVTQYNSLNKTVITPTAITTEKGIPLEFTIKSNSKIGLGKENPSFVPPEHWIEYSLFLKCIRGDPGDNIFSAYPGVRLKGSKKNTGLNEAFEDRITQGYAWNNILLQRWTDHNGIEHIVSEDYERNKMLIDLTCQPPAIKQLIANTVTNITPKAVQQVGVRLIQFCNSYEMTKIVEHIHPYAIALNAKYPITTS
jgi:5'-3' exonuclease